MAANIFPPALGSWVAGLIDETGAWVIGPDDNSATHQCNGDMYFSTRCIMPQIVTSLVVGGDTNNANFALSLSSTLDATAPGHIQVVDASATSPYAGSDLVMGPGARAGITAFGAQSYQTRQANPIRYSSAITLFNTDNDPSVSNSWSNSISILGASSSVAAGAEISGRLMFAASRGTYAAPANLQTGDNIGAIYANTWDGQPVNGIQHCMASHITSSIIFFTEEALSFGTGGTNIVFSTGGNSSLSATSNMQRLRLDSFGQLVIGASLLTPTSQYTPNLVWTVDNLGNIGAVGANRPANAYLASSLHINGNAASACLEASSTTQGFLPPSMSTSQKTAIASPASGLMVYDNTLNKLCVFTGSAWETVTSA